MEVNMKYTVEYFVYWFKDERLESTPEEDGYPGLTFSNQEECRRWLEHSNGFEPFQLVEVCVRPDEWPPECQYDFGNQPEPEYWYYLAIGPGNAAYHTTLISLAGETIDEEEDIPAGSVLAPLKDGHHEYVCTGTYDDQTWDVYYDYESGEFQLWYGPDYRGNIPLEYARRCGELVLPEEVGQMLMGRMGCLDCDNNALEEPEDIAEWLRFVPEPIREALDGWIHPFDPVHEGQLWFAGRDESDQPLWRNEEGEILTYK
jgi:hypothetical protein